MYVNPSDIEILKRPIVKHQFPLRASSILHSPNSRQSSNFELNVDEKFQIVNLDELALESIQTRRQPPVLNKVISKANISRAQSKSPTPSYSLNYPYRRNSSIKISDEIKFPPLRNNNRMYQSMEVETGSYVIGKKYDFQMSVRENEQRSLLQILQEANKKLKFENQTLHQNNLKLSTRRGFFPQIELQKSLLDSSLFFNRPSSMISQQPNRSISNDLSQQIKQVDQVDRRSSKNNMADEMSVWNSRAISRMPSTVSLRVGPTRPMSTHQQQLDDIVKALIENSSLYNQGNDINDQITILNQKLQPDTESIEKLRKRIQEIREKGFVRLKRIDSTKRPPTQLSSNSGDSSNLNQFLQNRSPMQRYQQVNNEITQSLNRMEQAIKSQKKRNNRKQVKIKGADPSSDRKEHLHVLKRQKTKKTTTHRSGNGVNIKKILMMMKPEWEYEVKKKYFWPHFTKDIEDRYFNRVCDLYDDMCLKESGNEEEDD